MTDLFSFDVEVSVGDKVPFFKLLRPQSQMVGEYTPTGQLMAGEFVITDDLDKHGVAVEFLPVVPAIKGYRLRGAEGEPLTLCHSNDRVRPVMDFNSHGRLFYDPRTGQDIKVDFRLAPAQGMRDNEGNQVVGGCQACPLSKWNEKRPPVCRDRGTLVMFVVSAYRFDPKPGIRLQGGNPVAHFRENGFDEDMFTRDQLGTLTVMTAESYAYDTLVEGKFTPDRSKDPVPSMDSFLAGYTHTGAANPEIDELLRKFNKAPEKLLVFADEAMNLYSVREAARLEENPGLYFYGFRTIRMYTRQTPNANYPSNPHITPVLELGDDVLAVDTEMYDQYLEYRGKALEVDNPVKLLGWGTTEDYIGGDVEDMQPLKLEAPSAKNLSAGEGFGSDNNSGEDYPWLDED